GGLFHGVIRVAVRPHVDLRGVKTVCAENRTDVRAVVAAVVCELRHEHPGGDEQRRIRGLPARIADDAVGIELRAGEELLDTILDLAELRRDLIERDIVVLAEHRLGDRHEATQIALVSADDVFERAADRPVGSGNGELELPLAQGAASLEELLRRPDVVTELAEHRRRHQVSLASRLAPSSIAYGQTCRSGVFSPFAPRIVPICARWSLPWCTNCVSGAP